MKTVRLKLLSLLFLGCLCLSCLFPGLNARAAGYTVVRDGINHVSGFDYVLRNDKMFLTNSTMTSTDPNWTYSANHANLYYGKTLDAGEKYVPGTVTVRFYGCIESANGEECDLLVTLSNIWFFTKSGVPDKEHSLISDYGTYGACLNANTLNGSVSMGTWVRANYKVVKHGTNTVAPGKLFMGFQDLDIPDYNGVYSGDRSKYQESIHLESGVIGSVHVQPDCCLAIANNNLSYYSSKGTSSAAEELTAGLGFLADTSGLTFTWCGYGAGTAMGLRTETVFPRFQMKATKEGPGTITPAGTESVLQNSNRSYTFQAEEHAHIKSITVDGKAIPFTDTAKGTHSFSSITVNHSIHVVFEQDMYSVKTQVRRQGKDGTYSSPETVDTKTVPYGSAYSYTWVRGTAEPENIYGEPNPKTVGTSSVTEDAVFTIDIPRKTYNWTFTVTVPSGHALSEVRDMQENLSGYAETENGSVKTPSLAGYQFLGWKDAGGNAYAPGQMLSDKAFTGSFKALSYKVRYVGNGSSNPGHISGESVQNQVTSVFGMPDSVFAFDTAGTLRTNDFIRNGYTFVGWNTKADGSGTSYADKTSVKNLTSEADGVVTLYAQWQKKPGNETLTVVSEETGNPVPGVTLGLYRNENGSWKKVREQTTDKNGKVSVSDLPWFAYEWRNISVPDGYTAMESAGFSILYDHLESAENRTLYLRRVSVTLKNSISRVVDGERLPSFTYHIEGKDAAGIAHAYDLTVPVGSSFTGSGTQERMFAGTYTITQVPVSRYQAETCKAVENGTVSGINGSVTLLTGDHGELLFPYTLTTMDGASSYDGETNHFQKGVK